MNKTDRERLCDIVENARKNRSCINDQDVRFLSTNGFLTFRGFMKGYIVVFTIRKLYWQDKYGDVYQPLIGYDTDERVFELVGSEVIGDIEGLHSGDTKMFKKENRYKKPKRK